MLLNFTSPVKFSKSIVLGINDNSCNIVKELINIVRVSKSKFTGNTSDNFLRDLKFTNNSNEFFVIQQQGITNELNDLSLNDSSLIKLIDSNAS